MNTPQLFTSMYFRDFETGAAFLRALGFVEKACYRSDDDPGIVVHAEFGWRDNGGLMAGSIRPDSPHATDYQVGGGNCYLVTASDAEVDEVYARAMAAGGTSTGEPAEMDYGGRGAGVRDPEGNAFAIGSYPGHP